MYCRSDAACLCLSCDRNVHSANALSKRHQRTLLCERCNSQPALVRCSEEKITLCQNCDWLGHGPTTSFSMHKRQTVNCYSGCPSAEEFSSIWSFVLDIPSMGETTCEQELGLMSINENSNKSSCVPSESQDVSDSAQVTDLRSFDKSRTRASAIAESSSEPRILAPSTGPTNERLPKVLSTHDRIINLFMCIIASCCFLVNLQGSQFFVHFIVVLFYLLLHRSEKSNFKTVGDLIFLSRFLFTISSNLLSYFIGI